MTNAEFEQRIRGTMAKFGCNESIAQWRVKNDLRVERTKQIKSAAARALSREKKISMELAYRLL